MSHFLLAFVSQFHVLHLFASPLLLDFVSLLLIVLVLTQSFYSQLLNLLAFLLLLSLESLYLPLLLPLLLLLSVLDLLFFSQHFLRLLSPFPKLQPLLAPLLFSEPLSFPAFYFPSLVYVPLHVHLPFQYISALILLCLSLVAPSATQSVVSASLILLYVIFQHFLLLLSPQVSVFLFKSPFFFFLFLFLLLFTPPFFFFKSPFFFFKSPFFLFFFLFTLSFFFFLFLFLLLFTSPPLFILSHHHHHLHHTFHCHRWINKCW